MNNVLKSIIRSQDLLSFQQMSNIKGGSITNPVALENASDIGIEMSMDNNAPDAVEDDKRRQRPGGGVSTL